MVSFFFNDTATTEIYTLSLHDALPISFSSNPTLAHVTFSANHASDNAGGMYNYYTSNPTLTSVTFSGNQATEYGGGDRKSTRLNSSHANISYAVFCLKKKIQC